MTDTYSITELAREFDITTRTIRFYEDKGLLQPRRRGTTRIYGKGDRTRLKLVLRGRRLGWPLLEIREMISMYDHSGGEQKQLEAMICKLRQNRAILLKQREDIKLSLEELNELEQNCARQLDALKPGLKPDLTHAMKTDGQEPDSGTTVTVPLPGIDSDAVACGLVETGT